jgi:hypothetical protein
MNKKVILGPASGASEHNVAKPFGLGGRVDDTSTRGKLVFLSGEACVACIPHGRGASPAVTPEMITQESAEGIVAI